MTPQEKAEDLMNKMLGLELEDLTKFDYIDHEAAKHFSLISVHEIIETLKDNASNSASWLYWAEVKQEIENL